VIFILKELITWLKNIEVYCIGLLKKDGGSVKRKKSGVRKSSWNLDQKLKTAIRKVWAFSPQRKACLKAAYNKDTDDWNCALCGRRTERATVDHIYAVGLAKDWNEFIRCMFEGLMQAVCKKCHTEKSKLDVKKIKESKK
jgi:hypothetical protein